PLYHTHSAREVLAAFSDKPGVTDYDALRGRLKSQRPGDDAAFEKFWRKTLNDGFVANSALAPLSGVSAKVNPGTLTAPRAVPPAEYEFIFRPDPCVYDGRFANNGWLQELAKPVSKLAWDNAAYVSPQTKDELDLNYKVAARGGEHGQIVADVVDISLS